MKIDRGIPIPRKGGAKGKWRNLCDEMKAGDSVLFPSREETFSLLNIIRKTEGYTAKTRTVEGGIRVWKVKKEES